jgi:hypothetical protein
LDKVKKFLLEKKDVLLFGGQIALVLLVLVKGIQNDLAPQDCKCKRCQRKRKKRRKKK